MAVQWVTQYWGLKGKLAEYYVEKHAKPQGHMEVKVKRDSLSVLELIEIFNIDRPVSVFATLLRPTDEPACM